MRDPRDAPATPHRALQIRDLDAALERLGKLYGEVSVRIRGAFVWEAAVTNLGPVALVQGACDVPVTMEMAPAAHVLSFFEGGAARVSSSRGETELGPGRGGALASPGTRASIAITSRNRTLNLIIDPRFLAAQLEALTGETVKRPISFALQLHTHSEPGAYVERLCRFLAGEVERGTGLHHPALLTSLHEGVARALLIGQPHDHAHLLEKPAPASSPTVVRLVEEFVDAHAGGPVRMADLTALTGVSVASMEASFRAHRGTTPAAFLRARRLGRARQALLGGARTPLGQLAHAAGFLRPEVFEAAYVEAFQETPEATRRRGLAAVGESSLSADPAGPRGRLAHLAPRERDVCARAARGMLNKQIAAELGLSERTVKDYRARAMVKLGVGSAAEMARLFALAED